MMEKLDFLVRFWELKARHELVGEPLTASEQIELLSLLQLVTGDLELPLAGPLARPSLVLPAELIGEGVIVQAEIRAVSAAALFVSASAPSQPGAPIVLRATDAISGVEYTIPCRVAWAYGSGPASMALRVDGVPVRSFFSTMPDSKSHVSLSMGPYARFAGSASS
jgi:hypothetical protein